jgi:hypothetical protein
MNAIAAECCVITREKPKTVVSRPERLPPPAWSRVDLDIRSFIRLASGGIDTGFDGIFLK